LKYLVYIFLFCFSSLKAQNLITNPSFEDIDSCYGQSAHIGFDVFEWSGCKGWSNPIKSSSDLWCQNPIVGTMIPPNTISYQKPKTGENMAGFVVMVDVSSFSYREFIQNKLTTTLEQDKLYKLSFYYSVDVGIESGGCPPNQFGVYGSSSKLKDTSAYFLSSLTPLGSSDENKFVDDTSGWYLCEIVFKANGGENFLTIGNFQDSSNSTFNSLCDTSSWDGMFLPSGYFFLDDFSVTEYFEYSIPNVFTPNNDNINDLFFPRVLGIEDWEMTILNRWGNNIIVLDKNNSTWSGQNFSDGIYFYIFKIESKAILKQGFFQLIR
jgi:gliding motility-associated-like protein